jgi:SAM-dependent methyltransferase
MPARVSREISDWLFVSGIVGAAIVVFAAVLGSRTLPPYRMDAQNAALIGLGLLTVVLVVARAPDVIGALLDDGVEPATLRAVSRPRLTLFIVSFVALFLELVLIRYAAAQIRVFAFFKNVPLIAAYLGLGVGCALGAGRPRHAVAVVLWFIPLAAALAGGGFIFAGALSRAAATATTEQILGDVAVRSAAGVPALLGQIGVAAFCFVALLAIASLFVPIGRLLGGAFEQLPRLPAYTINILGSLAGTLAFMALSYMWMPPWSWVLVGLAPLLWWLDRRRATVVGAGLIALSVLATAPSISETIWSPYQKLIGQPYSLQMSPSAPPLTGYIVDISDVFYQVAMDLRPESVARAGGNPFPNYDAALRGLSQPIDRVLVVGAGTGNDVAAALRAGAKAVDAVDIDPAIVALGRRHHPEQPYSDPRVHVIIDDARAVFRRLPIASYDAVLFGLLDSHTQLGMSSLRLDNYVFTQQSFREARRLVRPGGRIVVTAATFRDWFRQRFVDMLTTVCDSPLAIRHVQGTAWVSHECAVADANSIPSAARTTPQLPTDDWPFLYLPRRGIPMAYAVVVLVLAFGSVLLIRVHGLSPGRFTGEHAHMFLLGAGFLLMEVYAINRLALLFGATWTVSAVAIVIVLTLIAAANFTTMLAGAFPYWVAYLGLFTGLVVSYAWNPDAVLGRGSGAALAYGVAALIPVYFAGLVFARSFARAPMGGAALAANMLGAVVGGWAEYASMALGIRALVILAAAFYIGSWVSLAARRHTRVTGEQAQTSLS